MLPRLKNSRALTLGAISAIWVSTSIFSSPATGIVTRPTNPVISEISLSSFNRSLLEPASDSTIVIAPRPTSEFTLVGVTWAGSATLDGTFYVKVHEMGEWTDWFSLNYSGDHGPDSSEVDAETRSGTDPLLTAPSDGVSVKYIGDPRQVPSDIRLTLIDSRITDSDRALIKSVRSDSSATQRSAGSSPTPSSSSTATPAPTASPTASPTVTPTPTVSPTPSVTPTPTPTPTPNDPNTNVSPQGAVVPMPTIVTRAQWGADESWRDVKMKYGTTILAGFIHHTATTNSYSPSEGPAQMRVLYAYFTKSLKYADMGYNFLVDQYGVLYEGRSGGMNSVVQGAHTAGMNVNTFAVSAIGNYDTKDLTSTQADAMTTAISKLMAWKLAKYGLSANGTAHIKSTDTSGKSQYSAGKIATTPVISGHRDVGRTACPGRYLYPYIPSIRAKTAALLTPVIQSPKVAPAIINTDAATDPVVTALIPANATWSISISERIAKHVVRSFTGQVTTTSTVRVPWDRKNTTGALVANGTYDVIIRATVGSTTIKPRKLTLTIGAVPRPAAKVTLTNLKARQVVVTWKTSTADFPVVSSAQIRLSKNGGVTWGKWVAVKAPSSSYRFTKLVPWIRYTIQIRTRNAIGKSVVVTKSIKTKR